MGSPSIEDAHRGLVAYLASALAQAPGDDGRPVGGLVLASEPEPAGGDRPYARVMPASLDPIPRHQTGPARPARVYAAVMVESPPAATEAAPYAWEALAGLVADLLSGASYEHGSTRVTLDGPAAISPAPALDTDERRRVGTVTIEGVAWGLE